MAHVISFSIGKDCPAFEFDMERICSADLIEQLRKDAPLMYRLAAHGAKQKHADARAGFGPTRKNKETGAKEPNPDYSPENATALCAKVRDALYAGEWGRERGESATLSPVEARMYRIARAVLDKYIRSQGEKPQNVENYDELLEEHLDDTNLETGNAWRVDYTAQAERELAAESARPTGVSLGKLGLKIKSA